MRFILAVFSVIFGISLIKQVIDYECRGKELKGLDGKDIDHPHAMFVAEVLAVVTAIIIPASAIIGFIKHR